MRNCYFETTVEIPLMKVGRRQTIETLISEEALLFAKYLRGENDTWIPRVPSFPLASSLFQTDTQKDIKKSALACFRTLFKYIRKMGNYAACLSTNSLVIFYFFAPLLRY